MLIYFDECYDGAHQFLILGALFNPKPKKIHRDFLKEKQNQNYIRPDGTAQEIKYNYVTNHKRYNVAKKAIDCFFNSQSFFRAIVIDQRAESGFDIGYFGRIHETRALKEARAYKRYMELLLESNMVSVSNAVLLTDRLTRCKGDACLELIEEKFGRVPDGMKYPIIKEVHEVDTALEQYHTGQINDILQGVILNELVPTQNKWKRNIRDYVKSKLIVPSLGPGYWKHLQKWEVDQRYPKYQVWYWQPHVRDTKREV